MAISLVDQDSPVIYAVCWKSSAL